MEALIERHLPAECCGVSLCHNFQMTSDPVASPHLIARSLKWRAVIGCVNEPKSNKIAAAIFIGANNNDHLSSRDNFSNFNLLSACCLI